MSIIGRWYSHKILYSATEVNGLMVDFLSSSVNVQVGLQITTCLILGDCMQQKK